jgi:hypothetical protein
MGQHGREANDSSFDIDRGRLYRRDLMPAKDLRTISSPLDSGA